MEPRPSNPDAADLDRSPSSRLLFRNTMAILPGHADDFRRAIVDAVSFAEQHAPQLMVDVFVDEAEGTATSFQLYADSAAVERHWQLSDPYIAEVMHHCTVREFEVFGAPSDSVRAALHNMFGPDLPIHPRMVGYLHRQGQPG